MARAKPDRLRLRRIELIQDPYLIDEFIVKEITKFPYAAELYLTKSFLQDLWKKSKEIMDLHRRITRCNHGKSRSDTPQKLRNQMNQPQWRIVLMVRENVHVFLFIDHKWEGLIINAKLMNSKLNSFGEVVPVSSRDSWGMTPVLFPWPLLRELINEEPRIRTYLEVPLSPYHSDSEEEESEQEEKVVEEGPRRKRTRTRTRARSQGSVVSFTDESLSRRRPKSVLRRTKRDEEKEHRRQCARHEREYFRMSQEEEQKEEEQKEEEKKSEATAEKTDFLRDMSDLFDAVSLNGNAKKETKKLVSLLRDTLSGTVTNTTSPLGAVAAGADNPPPNMGVGLAGAVATAPPPPPGVDRYGGGGFGFASSSSSSGYGSASTFMGSTVYSSFIPPSPPWMASMDEERTEPLASRIARLEAQGGLVLQPATVKKETNQE